MKKLLLLVMLCPMFATAQQLGLNIGAAGLREANNSPYFSARVMFDGKYAMLGGAFDYIAASKTDELGEKSNYSIINPNFFANFKLRFAPNAYFYLGASAGYFYSNPPRFAYAMVTRPNGRIDRVYDKFPDHNHSATFGAQAGVSIFFGKIGINGEAGYRYVPFRNSSMHFVPISLGLRYKI